MAKGTCSVEGCERLTLAKGLCKAHYERNRRNGTPGGLIGPARFVRPVRLCSVDGCDRLHKTNGFCALHYQRWCKWGDPLICKPAALYGEDHPGWKGVDLTYIGAHRRVFWSKGRASEHACVECGGPAKQWAYDHGDPNELIGDHGPNKGLRYSADPAHYQPMCASCHRRLDNTHRRGTATT